MTLWFIVLLAGISLPTAAQQEQPLASPAQSVVQILAKSECTTSQQGSGVLVEPGIVLTSLHVVEGAENVKIVKDGKIYYSSAHILAPELDLCLLRVPALPGRPTLRANEDAIKVGVKVTAIGFPGGSGLTETSGIITEQWHFRGSNLIQSNASVWHGNSGGGLFTKDGHLIGIVTFGLLAYEGLNFCVPVSCVPSLLRRPWQEGAKISLCRSRELFLESFLEGMTEDPSNRPAWNAYSSAWVASRPKDPDAWYSLGHSLSIQVSEGGPASSLLEGAQQAYRKAVDLNPRFARAWNNLGVIQDELGETEAAIASLRMAVSLKEDYSLARFNLGAALINRGSYSDAAQSILRGLDLAPDDAASWARLSLCRAKLGQTTIAIQNIRTALALYPMRREWWVDLARICRTTGRPGEFEASLAFLRDRLPIFAGEISRLTTTTNL